MRKWKLTRITYEFHTGLHTICDILAYGRGRTPLISSLHSSHTTTETATIDTKTARTQNLEPGIISSCRAQKKQEQR